MTDTLLLLAAIVLAGLGGDLFLRGVVGTATWLRLPPLLIATTLSAAATSSPELSVSVLAALDGRPGIGLGDALGSNVVNMALCLGLSLLFGPMEVRFADIRRDFIFALFVPPITFVLALDGTISQKDGALLVLLFFLWLTLSAKQALSYRKSEAPVQTPSRPWLSFWYSLAGLVCLLLAGRLFVTGASGIAAALGLSNYVIGATLVAIGTSLPELVTVLLSRWRGHHEVGLGTVLGSNLFNGLVIVGTAASIHPIGISLAGIGTALGAGLVAVAMVLPWGNRIQQLRSLPLLLVYAAFAAVTIAWPGH